MHRTSVRYKKVVIKSGNLAFSRNDKCKSNSYNSQKAMTDIDKVIEIFCSTDEFCKNLGVELRKKTSNRPSRRGREAHEKSQRVHEQR